LYGKNPAKSSADPAAAGSAPADNTPAAAPAAAASKPSTASDKKPDDKKAEAKPAVSADPLGDLAKAKAGAGDEPFVYFVQLGAYRTMEDAESQRAKLSLSGIETKISEREQSGRTVFRVRVGPFDKKEEGERSKEKLDKAGLETALVRVQR
jgi:cell division protein FtsN